MSYSGADVHAATTAMDKYRGGDDGEAGSALVVVGLSAERVEKEAAIRDDMIPRRPPSWRVDPPTR